MDYVFNLKTPTTSSKVRRLPIMRKYCRPSLCATQTQRPFLNLDCSNNCTHHSLFLPGTDTKISLDASPVGLAAILSQIVSKRKEEQILTYGSLAFTHTEQRYSQTKLRLSLSSGPASTYVCTSMAISHPRRSKTTQVVILRRELINGL